MTNQTEDKTARAKEQARAQLDSIIDMVKASEEAREADEFAIYEGEEVTTDDMAERMQSNALDVQVRSDWHTPGTDEHGANEYSILLCTGGPAVRIIGELDEYGQPETTNLEYQDWFTPWERYQTTLEENDIMRTYALQFYFGE